MSLKTDGEVREKDGRWIEYAGQRRSMKSLGRSRWAVGAGSRVSFTGIGSDGGPQYQYLVINTCRWGDGRDMSREGRLYKPEISRF